MHRILFLFRDICLFKKGPEDLPYSPMLMAFLLFINVVISILQIDFSASTEINVIQILLLNFTLLGFFYVLLLLKKLTNRFVQTISAILGADVIVMFFTLPVYLLQVSGTASHGSNATPTSFMIFMAFYAVFLSFWQIAITTHILRRALDVAIPVAMLLTFSLLGFQLIVFQLVK